MEVLVYFKHKSMKDYWNSKNYQHNKILVEVKDEEHTEMEVDFKVQDILHLMYPKKDGAGYGVLYQYEITKIDKNPYNKKVAK